MKVAKQTRAEKMQKLADKAYRQWSKKMNSREQTCLGHAITDLPEDFDWWIRKVITLHGKLHGLPLVDNHPLIRRFN